MLEMGRSLPSCAVEGSFCCTSFSWVMVGMRSPARIPLWAPVSSRVFLVRGEDESVLAQPSRS